MHKFMTKFVTEKTDTYQNILDTFQNGKIVVFNVDSVIMFMQHRTSVMLQASVFGPLELSFMRLVSSWTPL